MNIKAFDTIARAGSMILATLAMTAAAQSPRPKRQTPMPQKKACAYQFEQIPHGQTICKICSAAPGLGITGVKYLTCNDGKFNNPSCQGYDRMSCRSPRS